MISIRLKEAKNGQKNKVRMVDNYRDFFSVLDKQFGAVTQLAE